MPIGTSDGQQFEDEFNLALNRPITAENSVATAAPKDTSTPETSIDYAGATGALLKKSAELAEPFTNPIGNAIQKAPEVANQLINAFTLPGDVVGGKVDPMSDEGIGRAADLAGVLVMGPAPLAGKIADGTLGSFAGASSKTADTKALEAAMVLDRKGYPSSEIYDKTGWFQGLDKKWRYEIPDHEAQFTENFADSAAKSIGDKEHFDGMYLDEAIKHPELFRAYPELKNVELQIDNSLKSLGAYLHGVPTNVFERAMGAKDLPDTKQIIAINMDKILDNPSIHPLEVVMHEVQHAIQRQEGFYTGSSPTASLESALNFLSNRIFRKGATDEEVARLSNLQDVISQDPKTSTGNPISRVLYNRDPGEIEARAVGARATQPRAREMRPLESIKYEADPLIIPGKETAANAESNVINHPNMGAANQNIDFSKMSMKELQDAHINAKMDYDHMLYTNETTPSYRDKPYPPERVQAAKGKMDFLYEARQNKLNEGVDEYMDKAWEHLHKINKDAAKDALKKKLKLIINPDK